MHGLTLRTVAIFYGAAIVYGLVFLALGQVILQFTLMIGFGLPIFLYLAMDFGASPLVSAAMGFQARWSVAGSVLYGVPLVALYCFVCPIAFAGNSNFGVPAPWVAAFQTTHVDIRSLVGSRLVYWFAVYSVFVAIGISSRWIVRLPKPEKS